MTVTRERAFATYLIVVLVIAVLVAGWFYIRNASSDITKVSNLTRAVDEAIKYTGTDQVTNLGANSTALSVSSGKSFYVMYLWRDQRLDDAGPLTTDASRTFSLRQVRWDQVAEAFRSDSTVSNVDIYVVGDNIVASVMRRGVTVDVPLDKYLSD